MKEVNKKLSMLMGSQECFMVCPVTKITVFHSYYFFQVTDISLDDTGGSVYITDGGLGHRFIEVRFNSLIGQGLDYVILAYANDSNLGHNSTYAKL